jgi:hypothetical protein
MFDYKAQFEVTKANKARRAAKRLRQSKRRMSVRRIKWLTKYAANLRKRIAAGEDYRFRLAEIEAELSREGVTVNA